MTVDIDPDEVIGLADGRLERRGNVVYLRLQDGSLTALGVLEDPDSVLASLERAGLG